MSLARRRQLVDQEHQSLSIARQCALLVVAGQACTTSQESLGRGPGPDAGYRPAVAGDPLGSRGVDACLDRQGCQLSRKRVQRLMRAMVAFTGTSVGIIGGSGGTIA